VLPDSLGEKHLLGDESDHVLLLVLGSGRERLVQLARACMVNTNFQGVKERGPMQLRIIVRSPNNDSRSGARKRARRP
jgi:hypothetical protein